jgi:hypothetical protein
MTDNPAVAAMAALSICESLLLSLRERGVLDDREIAGLLEDVVSTHRATADLSSRPDLHSAAAGLVERLRRGEDSTRALDRQGRGRRA